MNRGGLFLVAGFAACICAGCSKPQRSPVVIMACVPLYDHNGKRRPIALTLRNASDKPILSVRVSVDDSYVTVPVRIPKRGTRRYVVSNVEPESGRPDCRVWRAVFEGGQTWAVPPKPFWFP